MVADLGEFLRVLKNLNEVIEIGGGDQPVFHPNLDIRKLPGVDIVADLNKEWPIPKETVNGVYSSYVIEHVSWRKVKHFIGELFRILRPGGRALLVTANLKAQAAKIASKDDLGDEDLSMIFGGQNYEGEEWRANSHACGLSPASAQRLFQEVGFQDVITCVHPNCMTDMIIEVRKPHLTRTGEIPVEVYSKDYFNGGNGEYGGYKKEAYYDFPHNWNIIKTVINLKPRSVLELGCGRGYILKRIQDAKIPVMGLEVSRHCYLTRVLDGIVEWDITKTPWPVKDNSMDLCLSVSTLEHIHESVIDVVIKEIKRVCNRSFHVINFGNNDDGSDKTRILFKDKDWWIKRFGSGEHRIHSEQDFNKIALNNIPIGDGSVKVNLGSFATMFHYGWTNIDILDLRNYAQQNHYRFIQSDLTMGFPGVPADSAELICAAHLIEHLERPSGLNLLKECHRVLIPGGLIRLSCPDAQLIHRLYIEGRLIEFSEVNDGCRGMATNLDRLQAILHAGHKTVYDEESLTVLLKEAGFKKIQKRAFRESSSEKMLRESFDMLPCLSLYMEAIKD